MRRPPWLGPTLFTVAAFALLAWIYDPFSAAVYLLVIAVVTAVVTAVVSAILICLTQPRENRRLRAELHIELAVLRRDMHRAVDAYYAQRMVPGPRKGPTR